jgi:hypothetical protein
MVVCSHKSCGREQRVWLPKNINVLDNIRNKSSSGTSDTALHHWCILCGCVKNISDDHARKMGYWINVLSKIARKSSVTQSQKRLVIKELESYEYFDDLYCTTGSIQREVFVRVVKKHCSLCENMIDSFIY